MLNENGVLLLTSCHGFPEHKGLFLAGTLILGHNIYDGEGWIDGIDIYNGFITHINDRACGRYLLVNSTEEKIQVSTDDSGSEPLFLYQNSSGWVLSNSLYCIVARIKALGWPLNLNLASLASIFIDHSIGRTLFAPQTIYNEIFLVPLQKGLEICRKKKTCQLIPVSESEPPSDKYPSLLVNWFSKWRGILSAISLRESAHPLLLDLSGGIDSRMVLSLMLSGISGSDAKVHTQINSTRDAAIARSLGSFFGFDVGHEAPNRPNISVNQQFEKYLVGNLNFYHMPVAPALSATPRDIFKVNGIGGEVIRDFYPGTGQDRISKMPRILPNALKRYSDGVSGLLEDAFDMFGVDPRSPTSMREHYRQLRSRIHGGRRLHEKFKYKFISPLLDKEFRNLSRIENAPSPQEIYRDVLLYGGGMAFALHPFDHPKKNFSAAFCRESVFYRSDGQSGCDGEIEKFCYIRVKGKGGGYDSDWYSGAVEPRKFRSLRERISYEYTKLMDHRCDLALPAGFPELFALQARSCAGKRQKQMREVIGLSAIAACLNASSGNKK